MARIVVLQHNEVQHAGRLGRVLTDHGFRLDIRRPDLDPDAVPSDLDDLHGLLVLGGHQDIDESHPFLSREQTLIRMAHDAELPVVGICLGAQQIARALGANVTRMERPEVGVLPIELTVPAQTETIFAGIPWSCPMLQSHGFGIAEPPAGSTLLAASADCPVQSFKAGLRTYAFQFHFECDLPMSAQLLDRSAGLADRAGVTREMLVSQLECHAEMFDRAADRICGNLATFAFTFDELLSV
ncbi:MAG: type 1 glutamine amidotransferase [Planctomycetota bacterium]